MQEISRRSFVKKSLVTSAVLTGSGLGASGLLSLSAADNSNLEEKVEKNLSSIKVSNKNAVRPNIIIINTDDLGYGDLARYGGKAIHTPAIDKLADNGVLFTNFYACSSLCSPSRFGLLTGRYPQRVGITWPYFSNSQSLKNKFGFGLYRVLSSLGLMDMGGPNTVDGIPLDEITIPEALRPTGYKTGMVGKWHLGEFPVYPQYHPLKHGFDFFFGVPHGVDMANNSLYRNEELLAKKIKNPAELTGMYTQEAINFIEKSKESPFFLYFAHTFPHQPHFASENFKGKSKGGRYGDTVEEIDWSVEKVMECLEKHQLIDNTLVIFTSDNGPFYHGSPGRLRGRKGESYEGGSKVPFIAHWPGKIPKGSVCNEPAMNIDFLPTCLALAGTEVPNDRVIDGKNIWNLMTGADKTTPHKFLCYYHYEELEAIRVGKWKYIRKINSMMSAVPMDKNWPSAGSRHAPWLHNLETDPDESYNLREDYPEIAQKMSLMMAHWDKSMQENPKGWKQSQAEAN